MKTSHTLAAAGEIPRGMGENGMTFSSVQIFDSPRERESGRVSVCVWEREWVWGTRVSINRKFMEETATLDWLRARARERDSPGKTTCRSFSRAWFYLADEIMSASHKFEWRRACATFALVTIFAFAAQDAIQLRLFSLGNLISHLFFSN